MQDIIITVIKIVLGFLFLIFPILTIAILIDSIPLFIGKLHGIKKFVEMTLIILLILIILTSAVLGLLTFLQQMQQIDLQSITFTD